MKQVGGACGSRTLTGSPSARSPISRLAYVVYVEFNSTSIINVDGSMSKILKRYVEVTFNKIETIIHNLKCIHCLETGGISSVNENECFNSFCEIFESVSSEFLNKKFLEVVYNPNIYAFKCTKIDGL